MIYCLLFRGLFSSFIDLYFIAVGFLTLNSATKTRCKQYLLKVLHELSLLWLSFQCVKYLFSCFVFSLRSEPKLSEVLRPCRQAREVILGQTQATFDWSGMLSGSIYSTLGWGRKDLRLKMLPQQLFAASLFNCPPPTLDWALRHGGAIWNGLLRPSLSSGLAGATSGQAFS